MSFNRTLNGKEVFFSLVGVALFIWLYNTINSFWIWVIVIGTPAIYLYGRRLDKEEKKAAVAKKKAASQTQNKPVQQSTVAAQPHIQNDAWTEYCAEIENAWGRGDYDWARQQLQKIAYSMVDRSVTAEEKSLFTKLMADFAKEDPLYKEVMERLLPLVQANPGLVQSQIYKGEQDHIKEQMRYVLYFAQELGHIRRERKGNSYKLYPPDVKEMYGNKFVETKRENGLVTYESLPKYAGGTGSTITATIDEETAELHRRATALKDAGDMDGAVEALKKVKDRTGTAGVRFPLFLQQAGRFDESMEEFNRLLNEVESISAKDFGHHPERFWKGFSYQPRSEIYDKMRLACKRQKLPDEAAKYEALRDEFREKSDKFKEEFDEWHRKDMERKRAELENHKFVGTGAK